jgi:hypothetical protein
MAAILIGFSYMGESRLPGMIIDLYSIYRLCKNLFNTIFVITDIQSDPNIKNLRKMILDDILDIDVGIFITELSLKQQYIPYKNKTKLLNDLHQITSYLYDVPSLLVYYSGHGIIPMDRRFGFDQLETFFLLPDNSTISPLLIRDMIVKACPSSVEILWLMDCCHCSSLNLPYKFFKDKFLLNIKKGNTDNYFPPQNIILIVSSSQHEKSITTWKGSLFTYEMVTLIRNKIRSFAEIESYLTESVSQPQLTSHNQIITQTISIYSGHPLPLKIWDWVYGIKNFHIRYDPNIISLVLKFKKWPLPKKYEQKDKYQENKLDHRIPHLLDILFPDENDQLKEIDMKRTLIIRKDRVIEASPLTIRQKFHKKRINYSLNNNSLSVVNNDASSVLDDNSLSFLNNSLNFLDNDSLNFLDNDSLNLSDNDSLNLSDNNSLGFSDNNPLGLSDNTFLKDSKNERDYIKKNKKKKRIIFL